MIKITRNIKFIIPVFIYFFGVLSLFVFDAYITKFLPENVIKEWASLKSNIMIIGPLFLLGSANLIVRYPEEKDRLLMFSLLIISVFTLLFFFIGNFFSVNSITTFISALYGVTLLQSSFLRSKLKIFQAQFIMNLWKIILTIVIYLLVFLNFNVSARGEVSYIVGACMFLTVVLGFIFIFLSNPKKFLFKIQLPSIKEVGFSIKFMISTVTVACSAYLEILILTKISDEYQISLYYKHYLFFTAVAVFFSGYVGFVLTPIIRNNINKWGKIINKKIAHQILFSILFILLANLFFFESYRFYFKAAPRIDLVLIISVISCLRVMYIFPTSYMGAVANSEDLNKFVYSGLIGIVLFIGTFLIFNLFKIELLISLSFSSLINWLFRLIMAYISSQNIYNKL
jgi:hypothetical protein